MYLKRKKIIKIKTNNPYWDKNILIFSALRGKKVKRICEPSSGGTGTKLKTARIRFIPTMNESIRKIESAGLIPGKNLKINPKIRAKEIFAKGPAMATLAPPYF